MSTPPLVVHTCDAARRNDGVVLMTLGRNTRAVNETSDYEAIVAIDRNGEIVWTRPFDHALMDCRRSANDTLLVMGTYGRAYEIGFDGSLLNEWFCLDAHPGGHGAVKLDTLKIHHSICELSDGLLASVSIESMPSTKPFGDWDKQMGDTIVVFDRAGTIHREISFTNFVDPGRHSLSSNIPYYPMQGWPKTQDWTHANCLVEDPADGGLVISMRHQDAIVKVTRSGELVWILGDPTGWSAEWSDKILDMQGARPHFHQHDVSFAAAGELMFFDNGTSGAFPPNEPPPIDDRASFAVAYRIDEHAMTATETWRFGGNGVLPYTAYVSGVCETGNGNRFVACSGITTLPDGGRTALPPMGRLSVEFFEVTPDDEIVFHASLDDVGAQAGTGWNGFRPEFISDWPGG